MLIANSKKELLTILDRLIDEAIVADRIQYKTCAMPYQEKILYMNNTKYTISCYVDCLERMQRRLRDMRAKKKKDTALAKFIDNR